MRVDGKNKKSMWWNGAVKAAMERKDAEHGRWCWGLGMKFKTDIGEGLKYVYYLD